MLERARETGCFRNRGTTQEAILREKKKKETSRKEKIFYKFF